MQVSNLGLILAGACSASAAMGQNYDYAVYQFSDAAATTQSAIPVFADSSQISVPVAASTVRIRILAQGPSSDIGRVTLTSPATHIALTMISVGNEFNAARQNVATPTGNAWRGIEVPFDTFPNASFYGGIFGNLTDDVTVPRLRRLQLNGVIEAGADVTAKSSTEADPFVIVAGSVSGTSPVPRLWLRDGDIELVETNVGNMGGEVRAVHGSIKDVVVAGDLTGRVLAVGGATTQSPPDTSVVARIENIAVDGDITAQPFCGWDNGGC